MLILGVKLISKNLLNMVNLSVKIVIVGVKLLFEIFYILYIFFNKSDVVC